MDISAVQVTLRRFAAELLQLAEHASIPLRTEPGVQTHVLIDWENVQPDEADCLALVPDATDIWLFHGPSQKNVGRGYETFGTRATPVQISRTGKNALDFHLSFYVGYLAAKHPGSRLVVLSNDKGYGPMLDHAKQLGFIASQSAFGAVARKRPARKTAAKKTAAKRSTATKTAIKTATKTAAKTTPSARKAAAKQTATQPTTRQAAAKKAAPAQRQASAKKAPPARRPPSAKKAAAKEVAARTPPSPPAKAPRAATKKSFEQVLAILQKTSPTDLPAKRARLLKFVGSRIGAEAEADARAMLQRLEDEGRIVVDDKWNVSYRL